MESNEANFCKGYNYDNGRFIFNFRGAVSKISDYVFSDGHQEIIAKLSELALKSETLIYRGDFAGNLNDAASWKFLPESIKSRTKILYQMVQTAHNGVCLFSSQMTIIVK